jgi:hypothetical protein
LINKVDVILSERGPRRSLQPGGGESKDLRLPVFYSIEMQNSSKSKTNFEKEKASVSALAIIVTVDTAAAHLAPSEILGTPNRNS